MANSEKQLSSLFPLLHPAQPAIFFTLFFSPFRVYHCAPPQPPLFQQKKTEKNKKKREFFSLFLQYSPLPRPFFSPTFLLPLSCKRLYPPLSAKCDEIVSNICPKYWDGSQRWLNKIPNLWIHKFPNSPYWYSDNVLNCLWVKYKTLYSQIYEHANLLNLYFRCWNTRNQLYRFLMKVTFRI